MITDLLIDWNGTLLDDLQVCVDGINKVLSSRNLPLLDNDRYRNIFTFPVKDYYEAAGLDFDHETFEVPAMEFMDFYIQKIKDAALFQDTKEVLTGLKSRGYNLWLASAMEQELLDRLTTHFGVSVYFNEIWGIDDHYASGKEAMIAGRIKEKGITPAQTCLIGDTLHDAEVAKSLGLECILIDRGHQSAQRLSESGFRVVGSLTEAGMLLNGKNKTD
ncbi:MAG: HAD hydrolase-like protein [Bacteroidales bacterium]